jgi:hypothetical protein
VRGKSIFKNPAGWADTVAGSKSRYRFISAAVAAAGVLLLILTFLPSEVLWLRLVKGFLIVVFAIEIPLYCLRALHALLGNR